MDYINYEYAPTLCGGVYIGVYKDRRAFIHIERNAVVRIVLEDATHLFGSALLCIPRQDIMICIDESNKASQEACAKELLDRQRIIDDLYARIRELDADKDTAERHCKLSEKHLNEKTEQHDAQLRSAFYLLDQLEKVGTHHEKAVVIGYIRKCIAGFLKKDRLDSYNDLPF